ncbi:MAG: cyclic nucleotide-binding domain-containing protein [Chloroflexota bacterium]|nr:cyclic nucleotide-binding domain-containing protein [Chloroflexota bacterium]
MGVSDAVIAGAEAARERCCCRHTRAAHVGKHGECAFCRCAKFESAADRDALPPPPEVLSAQGQRAFEVLSQTEAFKQVAEEGLKALASRARRRLFLPDALIMKQDDASQALHVVVKGLVKVERKTADGRVLHLADLGPGEVIGEMGVLDGSPRSATVISLSDVETIELSAPVMKAIFGEYPEALAVVMRIVTERLRNTDDLVAKSVEIALRQLQSDQAPEAQP